MTKFSRFATTSLTAICLMSQAHAQGVPTADIQALAQRLVQIQQGVDTVMQMKSTVQSLTSNFNVGNLLNDPRLRSYLPDDWKGIYDSAKTVQNATGGNLAGSAAKILQDTGLASAPSAGGQQVNTSLAQSKAMLENSYDAMAQRLQNISDLMKQADRTSNLAEKADLQNRMSAELANVQTEQTRLQLAMKLQEVQTQLAERQAKTNFKNSLLGIK